MSNKKNWLLLFCSSFFMLANAQTTARLVPKKGLHLTTNQLSWIAGSEINFFTPNKKNHHYFFTWWDQDIDSSIKKKDVLFIGSKNTAVDGTYDLVQTGNTIRTNFNCNWNLNESSVADITYAKLWVPFLEEATWQVQGRTYTLNELSFFHDTVLVLTTPFGKIKFSSTDSFKVKRTDFPNPQKNDYDKRNQYLLLYANDNVVNAANGLHKNFTIEILSVINTKATILASNATLQSIDTIWQPKNESTILLPEPKHKKLIDSVYVIPTNSKSAITNVVAQYRNLLKLHWQIGQNYYPIIHTKINQQLSDEGYELSIQSNNITVQYKTNKGLQYAFQTLVQLTNNSNGKLVIPMGVVKDEPSVQWRGIHMFTGPTSLALHKKMYERILFPLKMNKVVLQCEQAQWKNFPEVHNPISISLKDLSSEFKFLRKHHVEPIPLIQSLGHMEWFFKPKKNRFMAVNPQYPYTLNPTLAASKKATLSLWKEVFDLLKPTTMHIGFDEIGMIGFNEPKEKEITYWKIQMKLMDSIAKSHQSKLMIWGDMGLAPNEGPDACNGITAERAAALRKTIPAGTLIGDWHYLSNPDPTVYQKSLQIWKQNNNFPIASPWLYPNNIKGFVHAAIKENAGVLQTTWADFESSEKNMLQNIEQFGAYILALDYAWSGREALPKYLPYDATKEWVNRLYGQPKPIQSKAGWKIMDSICLQDISIANKQLLPTHRMLVFKNLISISGWKINASVNHILPEGTTVAMLQLYNKKKLMYEMPIHYGVEVRANNDHKPIYAFTKGQDENVWFHFLQQQMNIDEIRIHNQHSAAGLTIQDFYLMK